jgi:hypothetical protein
MEFVITFFYANRISEFRNALISMTPRVVREMLHMVKLAINRLQIINNKQHIDSCFI